MKIMKNNFGITEVMKKYFADKDTEKWIMKRLKNWKKHFYG